MGDVFILSRAVLAMLRADTCLPFTSTIHYGKKRGPKTSGEAEEGDLINGMCPQFHLSLDRGNMGCPLLIWERSKAGWPSLRARKAPKRL